MKQVVKTLFVMLSIAMCLTSDTALYATQVESGKFQVQRSELRSSENSVACATTTSKPLYWDGLSWTPATSTRPCESLLP